MTESGNRIPAIRRYSYLALGAGLSLFAMGGRFDLAVAGWLSGVFLMRFARTSGPLAAAFGVWAALAAGSAFWLAECGLPVLSPYLLLCLLIDVALTLPFLLDRLAGSTLAFPAARVSVEYLIVTFGPLGGTFGTLAATQHQNLPLMQAASLTGSWGVSFLIAWFASVVNRFWEQGRSARRAELRTAVAFGAALVTALTVGGFRLAGDPTGASATVRIAGISPSRPAWQARVAALRKYASPAALAADRGGRAALSPVNDELLAMTHREAVAGARIVVWSEYAAMVLAEDRSALLTRVADLAQADGVYILVGLDVVTTDTPHQLNQAVLVGPTGQVLWSYDKSHPVPGMENLRPGPGTVPIVSTPYGRIGAVICFDADFPALMRQAAGRADIILVPSNDWLDFRAAHANDATVRAVENGYALVRPSAQGLSRAVDAEGRPLATADFFTSEQHVMVANVPTRGATTLYRWVGDAFAWACGILTLLTVVRAGVSRAGGRARSRRTAA